MTKLPLRPDTKGMDKALDLVEETLSRLKEREELRIQSQNVQALTLPTRQVDAQTSTTNLYQGVDDSRLSNRNTSVLIIRKSSKLSNTSARAPQHCIQDPDTSKGKKRSSSSEKSHSTHLNHNLRATIHKSHNPRVRNDGSNNCNRKYVYDSSDSHPCRYRCMQRKRSCSIDRCKSRGRVVPSSIASAEILRHADSEKDLLVNHGNTSWIPPLSQSSPREVIDRRSESNSKHSKVSHGDFQELKIPMCLNSRNSGELHSKSSSNFQPTISIANQRYAEPTLTAQMRVKLSERPEKAQKENLTPFIPSGSMNTTHHVGVIIQQQLGLLKNIPSKELKSIKGPRAQTSANNGPETDNDSIIPTESNVKDALRNIQEHIAHVARHSSK